LTGSPPAQTNPVSSGGNHTLSGFAAIDAFFLQTPSSGAYDAGYIAALTPPVTVADEWKLPF
jgi:hypothetical protein